MEQDQTKIRHIWNQERVPVIHRRTGEREKHRVRLPYSKENRTWLQHSGRAEPVWNRLEKCWLTPKSWFNGLVKRCLEHYGSVYIVQPYNEMEKCAPACKNATGFECECSCMGAYHGIRNDGSWFEVDEAFAFRWKGQSLACRLLRR
ncbi:hypothetical protein E5163_14460 [Marinicauda algicola]|uniref:Uncharacterized protein n=1 Tax=Marinicauda algicola TaxID=2029849 RepID=A0A4S2GX72_9PROT|nr:hypothetical protein E5163_14460 [Marinicauda algicola]